MAQEALKWMMCATCNRIIDGESKSELRRHLGHRLRNAGNEPWWHVLYRPILLKEWLWLKLGR